MADDPGEFGRRLREHRESAALSQEELAERANLTAKAIGALERGERRRPYPATVRALAAALALGDDEARALADAARPGGGPSPASTPGGATTSIPAPATPMLGRSAELQRVVSLLDDPATRIVTLTGPGGVGKTRLATEVAARLDAGGREVVFVDLASVRSDDLVLPAIARAVGLQTAADDPIGAIASLVEGRRPVLVLDNVEHVIGAATDVGALVQRCPDTVVLATSRAPLRLRTEQEVPILPLAVPAGHTGAAAVAESPAVQVFETRARTIVPTFRVDEANAAAVAEICRRLDGLPLAIELAAAHVRYLAPPLLLDRLPHALGSGRLRDLPERQRTMTATLDWSHDLLTGDEQTVLRALSVFAGGFDLDAAEAVAGSLGVDVLAALEGLVEQSLVLVGQADTSVPPRFRMLESVRGYASSAVDAAAAADLAARHAEHFTALCRAAATGLRDVHLDEWLDVLAREHANLRVALATLLDAGDAAGAARIGADTWLYWALRGHAGEGFLWWERTIDVGGDRLDAAGRTAAHLALAGLALATADVTAAREHADLAVDGSSPGGAVPLDPTEARLISCLAAASTGDLGTAARRLAEVEADAEAAIDVEPDGWIAPLALVAAAQVALLGGDVERCAEALDEAEALARASSGGFTLATVLNMQATIAVTIGDDATAVDAAVEAVELALAVGTAWTLVYSLSSLATLAARREQPELAARLLGASAATAEASMVDMAFRPDLETAEATAGQVRDQLGDTEFDRWWAAGEVLAAEDPTALLNGLGRPPGPS